MANTAPRLVGTAAHVCQIFDCFATAEASLTLTHIAGRIGLRTSSVHRLLKTLVTHEYLAFEPLQRRYRIGNRIGSLAAVHGRRTLGEIARPILERLRDTTRESAAVQIRTGDLRCCIIELPSGEPLRLELTVGKPYPVNRGSAGAVLRAFAPAWEAEPDRADLATIRERGYAISHGALYPGAVAIYAPVVTGDGSLVAALGVHGLEFRVRESDVPGIARAIRRAARELGGLIDADVPLGKYA